MSVSSTDVNAVKAAVESKVTKLLGDKVQFKNASPHNKDVLNGVCDLYQKAASTVGAKVWRVWDKFNKDTNSYTVTVELFFGKEKVVLTHSTSPAQVA